MILNQIFIFQVI